MRLIIVLVCFAFGTLAAVRSRFGALLFYVWFAIFRPQDWLWTPITAVDRPSLVVGLLLVVPSVLTGVWPVVSHPLSIAAVLFWLCGLLAQTNAVRPDLGWYWLDLLGKVILVGLFLVRLTSTRERFKTLIMVIAGSFAFYSAKAGLASLMGGGLRYGEGLTGEFSDSNAYAVGAVMVIPLLIAVAQNTESRIVRGVALAAIPLSAFTVISTFSRAGFLALAATTMLIIMLQRRRVLLGLGVTVLAVVGVIFAPLPAGYAERLQTIQTYDKVQEESALSRIHFWTVALHVAEDKPLGVGLYNFESIYDDYDFSGGRFGRGRAIHNSHLQALVEAGWLGAVVWLFMFTWAFRTAFRIRRRAESTGEASAFYRTMSGAMIGSLFSFLVGGTFVSLAYNDMTWFLLAAVAALDRLSLADAASRVPIQQTIPAVTVPVWRAHGSPARAPARAHA